MNSATYVLFYKSKRAIDEVAYVWHVPVCRYEDPCVPAYDSNYVLRIFPVNEAQRAAAERSRDAESQKRNCTVLMDIWNASEYQFWKAEEEHQQYSFKSGQHCSASASRANGQQQDGSVL